jgi:hypothetical protein
VPSLLLDPHCWCGVVHTETQFSRFWGVGADGYTVSDTMALGQMCCRCPDPVYRNISFPTALFHTFLLYVIKNSSSRQLKKIRSYFKLRIYKVEEYELIKNLYLKKAQKRS